MEHNGLMFYGDACNSLFRQRVTEFLSQFGFGVSDTQYAVFPGFCDVHVHFREPGFSYKETISTGSAAAARGGYTAVCTMPNLSPAPDTPEHLQVQQNLIRRHSQIHIYPYGTITMGQRGQVLSLMDAMSAHVCGFSDDGRGVQSEEMMTAAMVKARKLGKLIVAHCEDDSLLRGGYIHDGSYAKAHGHRGICSESEWGQIQRDLRLAEKTGCAYHVCHISTKESVALIRQAKARGVDVTCETAPHYLILDENDLREDGRFKMNPPLRGKADRLALLEGIQDGTIDMIATDHAPHAPEEKDKGLAGSVFGVVGLETAFPALYTHLVKPGLISMERLVRLLCDAPRQRFGLPLGLDFSLWDLSRGYLVNPNEFLSMGKSSPFTGTELFGRCCLTVCDGAAVWLDKTP